MASSAFKSTSKRGNSTTFSTSSQPSKATTNSAQASNPKIPHRRSRSVSAFSRSSIEPSFDFLNKRDNPLFNSSPPDLIESKKLVAVCKSDVIVAKVGELSKPVGGGVEISDGRRGRSVVRNGEVGKGLSGVRKDVGRSLSRVDTGRRRRSVSREHYENSESEKEQKPCLASRWHNQNNRNQVVTVKKDMSDSELSSHGRKMQTWSTRNTHSQSSDGFSSCVQDTNWEDVISTSSFSEAEEKTIKAVSEKLENSRPPGDAGSGEIYEAVRSEVRLAIMEIQNDLKLAIQRKDPTVISADNVGDIPPELVNPDAIELVSDIRMEYSIKLEESEERARKLRADLAVEEHRGQELGRILKEILPEPKASETRQSRFRRKSSTERRKISRRLTEEAMNYFDECVSISTFDSSDFSSTEDPSVGLAAAAPLVDKNVCFPFSSASSNHNIQGQSHLNHTKEVDSQVRRTIEFTKSNMTRDGISKVATEVQENIADSTAARSSAQVSTEAGGIHSDIRNYIKKFEKKNQSDSSDNGISSSSYYDSDDYILRVPDEGFLLDRIIFTNRIESGGLLLCGTRIRI